MDKSENQFSPEDYYFSEWLREMRQVFSLPVLQTKEDYYAHFNYHGKSLADDRAKGGIAYHTKQFGSAYPHVSEQITEWIFTQKHIEREYRKQHIPKKSGGTRELMIPSDEVKRHQKFICNEILQKAAVSSAATAYRKGVSGSVENAQAHVGKDVIVKMDIEDFFGNITYYQVYKGFYDMGYNPHMSVFLSNWCCCKIPRELPHYTNDLEKQALNIKNCLPQGGVASPAVSNSAMFAFDEELLKYCESQLITYTRYSDDLTFSFDDAEQRKAVRLINLVTQYLRDYGFNVNHKKTKIIGNKHPQWVTGLVVNQKLNTPKSYRRKIRQEVYYIEKYGLENQAKAAGMELSHYRMNLLGRISYVLCAEPDNTEFLEYKRFVKQECGESASVEYVRKIIAEVKTNNETRHSQERTR